MRHSGFWAIFAALTALLLAGCGGGGGNGGATAVNGVWTGSALQTRAVGNSSTLRVEFFQTGNTITGSGVFTNSTGTTVGQITGTVNGDHLDATINNPVAQRTEQLHGFNVPSFYSTSAPIDLAKPLVVSVDGVQLTPSAYTVDRTTLFTNRIFIQAAVAATSIVQIQYYPYDPNPGAGSTVSLTGSVLGGSITGSYTATTASGTQGGTFTLAKSAETTQVNMASTVSGGNWSGTYTLGTATYALAFNFTQTKDALTFSGTLGPPASPTDAVGISGAGAVIGNIVTLVFLNNGVLTTFTGAFGDLLPTVSGSTLDATGSIGAFTIGPVAEGPGRTAAALRSPTHSR